MRSNNHILRFVVILFLWLGIIALTAFIAARDAQGQELIQVNPYAGLNSAFSRDLVKPNQVIRLLNYWYHTPGDIEKRPGYSIYNHSHGGIDAFNVAGVYAATVIGTQYLLVVTGDSSVGDSERMGRLAIAHEATDDYDTTVMQNLPPGNMYDWATLQDTIFGVSGGAPMFSYTEAAGGKWTEHTPPGAPGVVAMGDIGSGEVYGVFQYAYKLEGIFTRIGPPSKPVRLQGQRCKIFGITPSIKEGSVGRFRYIYRRDVRLFGTDTTGGSWRRVDSIPIGDSLVTFAIDSINQSSGFGANSSIGGAHDIWAAGSSTDGDNTGQYSPGFPVWFFVDSCGTLAAECAGDGLQDGEYAYGLSWFNNEGDTMPIMTIGMINNTHDPDVFAFEVNLKTFPTLPAGVRMDSVIVWRSDVDSGGSGTEYDPSDTTFFEIGKDAIASMTAYVDTITAIPDSTKKYIGGNMFGFRHADSIPPRGANLFYDVPSPSQIETHQSQLWALSYEDQNSVQISEVRIIDSFPAGNKIIFPDAESDSLTAIFVIGEFMVAAQSRALYLVTGVDIFDFFKVKSESPVGVIAPQSVGVYLNTAFFLSETDVYQFSPPGNLKRTSDEIHDLLDAIPDSAKELAVGVMTDEGRYLLSINDTILVYDTRMSSWSGQWSFAASSFTYANFDGQRELLFGSSTGDTLYVFNTGDTAFMDAGVRDTAIVRLPYIGPTGNVFQIAEIILDRGGEGDSLLFRFFDERNVLVDSVWAMPDSFTQLFGVSPKAIGSALSIEIDDRGRNDSLIIRGLQLRPRNAGRLIAR